MYEEIQKQRFFVRRALYSYKVVVVVVIVIIIINKNRSVLQGLQTAAGWPSLKFCDDIYMSVIKRNMESNLNYAEK